ncbi:MAG: afsR 2 [Gemmataceae bacterium]|nr:afsR 2 [Gemmataceae bacterium]
MSTPLDAFGSELTASGDGSAAIGGNVHGNVNINLWRPMQSQSTERRVQQLPTPLKDTQFIGRGEERRKLKQLLNAVKRGKVALTALKGMGGVGKTTLAVYISSQLKVKFPDGQYFVDLRGTTEPLPPEQVMIEVIKAYHPTATELPRDLDAITREYRNTFAGKKVLFLLDNARDANQVRPLLPPEGCGLIITCRYTLDSLDGVEAIRLGEMTPKESVKLLRTLLPFGRATNEDLQTLAKLCSHLPLALNVAGSYLKGHMNWTIASYINALEKSRLDHLKIESDPAKDVEVVLSMSAAQLAREMPDLAATWQMLSVFPGAFDESEASYILDLNETCTKESLSRLLDWNLLLFNTADNRYQIHDLLRDIARKVFVYDSVHPYFADTDKRLALASHRHADRFTQFLLSISTSIASGGSIHDRGQLDRAMQAYAEVGTWIQSQYAVSGETEAARQFITASMEFFYNAVQEAVKKTSVSVVSLGLQSNVPNGIYLTAGLMMCMAVYSHFDRGDTLFAMKCWSLAKDICGTLDGIICDSFEESLLKWRARLAAHANIHGVFNLPLILIPS